MTIRHSIAVGLATLTVLSPAAARAAVQPVRLVASDGAAVFAAFYPASRGRATILLFHQAASSKGEYATIAPRLAAMGYDALAIDQRVGGRNETAERVGDRPDYGVAQRDLEAAYAWARRRGKPVVLWGSSYSAALVFRLAAQHPGHIAALLAFSPGEYLGAGPSVAASAAKVTAPVFVTSASDRTEIAAARGILSSVRSRHKTQHIPPSGIHGSSTLIASRNPRGVAANWAAVRTFLSQALR